MVRPVTGFARSRVVCCFTLLETEIITSFLLSVLVDRKIKESKSLILMSISRNFMTANTRPLFQMFWEASCCLCACMACNF